MMIAYGTEVIVHAETMRVIGEQINKTVDVERNKVLHLWDFHLTARDIGRYKPSGQPQFEEIDRWPGGPVTEIEPRENTTSWNGAGHYQTTPETNDTMTHREYARLRRFPMRSLGIVVGSVSKQQGTRQRAGSEDDQGYLAEVTRTRLYEVAVPPRSGGSMNIVLVHPDDMTPTTEEAT